MPTPTHAMNRSITPSLLFTGLLGAMSFAALAQDMSGSPVNERAVVALPLTHDDYEVVIRSSPSKPVANNAYQVQMEPLDERGHRVRMKLLVPANVQEIEITPSHPDGSRGKTRVTIDHERLESSSADPSMLASMRQWTPASQASARSVVQEDYSPIKASHSLRVLNEHAPVAPPADQTTSSRRNFIKNPYFTATAAMPPKGTPAEVYGHSQPPVIAEPVITASAYARTRPEPLSVSMNFSDLSSSGSFEPSLELQAETDGTIVPVQFVEPIGPFRLSSFRLND